MNWHHKVSVRESDKQKLIKPDGVGRKTPDRGDAQGGDE